MQPMLAKRSFVQKKVQAIKKLKLRLAYNIFAFGFLCFGATLAFKAFQMNRHIDTTSAFIENNIISNQEKIGIDTADFYAYPVGSDGKSVYTAYIKKDNTEALAIKTVPVTDFSNVSAVPTTDDGKENFVIYKTGERKQRVGKRMDNELAVVDEVERDYDIIDKVSKKEADAINFTSDILKKDGWNNEINKTILISLGLAILGALGSASPYYVGYKKAKNKRFDKWRIKNYIEYIKIYKDTYDVQLVLAEKVDDKFKLFDAVFKAEEHFKNHDELQQYKKDMQALIKQCNLSSKFHNMGYVTLDNKMLEQYLWKIDYNSIINENSKEIIPEVAKSEKIKLIR